MALPVRRNQPRSLSWHYHNTGDSSIMEEDEEAQGSPMPIPSREEMLRKYAFRQRVREETLQHRRIQEHGGLADTGRNISLVLRDRELLGSKAAIYRPRRGGSELTSSEVQVSAHQAPAQASPTSVHEQDQAEVSLSNNPPVISNHHNSSARNVSAQSSSSSSSSSGKQQLPRRVSYPMNIYDEIRTFAEYSSVIRYQAAFFNHLGGEDVEADALAREQPQPEGQEQRQRVPSNRAVSTISVAFSPDSKCMASTHGDHTVKITCCVTGRLLETLEGHPRTPWTVKFHPTDPHILASGCLGHQVRVWNWKEKRCLQMVRLEFAIISLSFHPSGDILAIANGTKLHFWGFNAAKQANTTSNNNNSRPPARETLTEVEQRHMLRCVCFPPDGNTLIVGGVNPTADDPRRRGRSGVSGQGMSFYLRLWDFDADTALRPFPPEGSVVGVRRRAISNVSSFASRIEYRDSLAIFEFLSLTIVSMVPLLFIRKIYSRGHLYREVRICIQPFTAAYNLSATKHFSYTLFMV